MHGSVFRPSRRRVFQVGPVIFDEARRELRVDGERRQLEAKPREVLHALLSRNGDIATKDELISAAWGEVKALSDTSLTTAISKLRAVLGPGGRDIIEAVHGIGYRIAGELQIRISDESTRAFTFAPGEAVPGRPQWRLERLLGDGAARDVWLARHDKTREARVFKFAEGAEQFDVLRREAALSRLLAETLGARADLVRILEWNFASAPYYLESPYGGPDLLSWVAQARWAAFEPATRIALVARVAATVAAAHAAGVLHGDIKPSNILVAEDQGGPPAIRLVDFGGGGITDARHAAALSIALTVPAELAASRGGTLRYMAPEVLRGGPLTTAADIYSLGILLYQMVIGDFDRPMTADWESTIADPLLRQDIAAAAAGDPAQRLPSAAELAERLERLEARRVAFRHAQEERAEAARTARQLERIRERRPWVMASVCSLVIGLTFAAAFGFRAAHERDSAQREAANAAAVNHFLTQDLMGRGNPINSGKPDESLMEAATASEPQIATRFASQPLVAASIYLALGEAFESRSAFDSARDAYDRAEAAYSSAEGPDGADIVIMRLRRAYLEASCEQPGGREKAKAMLARAVPRIKTLGSRGNEARVWQLLTQEQIDLVGDDEQLTLREMTEAADLADTMPSVFDQQFRLSLRLAQAVDLDLSNHFAESNALLTRLEQTLLPIFGPRHPDMLLLRFERARVWLGQHEYAKAEASLNELYPLMGAVFGPTHRQTLLTLFILAESRSQLEKYDAAINDYLLLYKLASDPGSRNADIAKDSLIELSLDYCRNGEGQTGLSYAHRAYEAVRAMGGDTSEDAQFELANVAFCQTVLHRYDDAAATLARIDIEKTAEADETPAEFIAMANLMKAEAALAGNRAADAARLLALTRQTLSRPGADPYLVKWLSRLSKELSG